MVQGCCSLYFTEPLRHPISTFSVLRTGLSYDDIQNEAESTQFCFNKCYDIHMMDRQTTIVVLISFSLYQAV